MPDEVISPNDQSNYADALYSDTAEDINICHCRHSGIVSVCSFMVLDCQRPVQQSPEQNFAFGRMSAYTTLTSTVLTHLTTTVSTRIYPVNRIEFFLVSDLGGMDMV